MKLSVEHDGRGFSLVYREPRSEADNDPRLLARLDTSLSGLVEAGVSDVLRRMVRLRNAAYVSVD